MAGIDLKDKPICVTGASSGIGRATAILCARAGMPVALSARREDRLRELVEQIRAEGGRALHCAGDVADADCGRRLVEMAMNEFGSVYAVFANAGFGVERPIHEMPEEDLRLIFETNFFGSMRSIRPALGPMMSRGEGHVLMCSSCVARFALPFYGAYSATKAAQHHIGRAMGLELAHAGIHVSTVHPVTTRTEFFDVARARSGDAPLVRHAPDLLTQKPEKVAKAVVRCLRRPRPEVWTSELVRWGVAIAGGVPRLADFAVRGHVRRRFLARAAEAAGPARNGGPRQETTADH